MPKLAWEAALELREQFVEQLHEAFAVQFDGLQINTDWHIIALRYSSERVDGKRFEDKHVAFIAGFESAWLRCSSIVGSKTK